MLPLPSLFQDFFLREKYIRARQNVLPSAEHLLPAQQYTQQHTHKPMAAFLPQQPYFGTRVKCLLVPTVKSPWMPLWIIMLEILEGVVVPTQEVAAPFEGCNLVPREVQLLAARHHDGACCCHRSVPHICYISSLSLPFCSWQVSTSPLPIHKPPSFIICKSPSFIIPKTLGVFFYLHDCKVHEYIWTLYSTSLCSWGEKHTFLEKKMFHPKVGV